MKKIFATLFLSVVWLTIIAQTYAPLSTPKGSLVTAYTIPEMSNSERQYWDTYYSASNRTQHIITGSYSSSYQFNCHGYAWSVAEGGPIRWIGAYVTTDEDIYMTDGSYIQVCSETYPGKVSWGSGDHSAITTSTAGRWKSKWNKFPLMTHDWNDTPYGTTNLKYYVETKIRGVDPFICGSNTYSVPSFSGGSYSWTSSSNITLNTTTGNSVVASSSGSGSGWVEVTISSSCASSPITTRLYVTIGPSIGPMSFSQNYFYSAPANVYAEVPMVANAGYYNYEWYLDGTFQQTSSYNHEFTFYGCGSHSLGVRALTSNCGWTDFSYGYFYVQCSGFSAINVFPNPSSDFLNIEIHPLEEEKLEKENEIKPVTNVKVAEYQVTLHDERGNLVRSGITNNGRLSINTKDLPEGNYHLLIPEGDKIISKQIIIEH